ncbi:MAG: hypothetical protein A2599_01300 [Candidatus Staskawiczbacteria bacterium RIFOXYD1_FULL_39_28]|uniref:Aspartyl/glutamyl-tRNA(Asn/Gln) amidotransferase subunit C n=1 Tax=Candidatus Staskawiczbacteria bacterium RIFOXYC1_FULL_38_18 TaxID=1802229 RepID=A0A1G2JEV3_9BACT|nr:MAG: hypothetical protein A2401_02380 [Candidatus Staskawiczbacteria bacterium RIFOXYC1_FULL_38_18]OGZ92503.1 MAG: hypothetical protein A2599_01300 [Candidatus Staskawiczbacteria bacterium RIFOXYD1_FULL_39_28]
MISKEEVEHIAKLARLELTEEEIIKMQADMSAILDYFALLQKAPKITERPAFAKGYGEARKDEILPRDAGLVEKLIKATPDKKDDYIKVKTIL